MPTAKALTDWAHEVVAAAGFRTCPLICTDLNDGFGIQRDATGRWKLVRESDDDYLHAGTAEPSREHGHSTLMREFMKLHHMCSLTSHIATGPTYYGEHGVSKIDHIILPLGARGHVEEHRALVKSMRRLQVIKTASRRDHCPMLLRIDMRVIYQASKPRAPKWSQDDLMRCLTHGACRREFVNKVDSILADVPENHRQMMRDQSAPDKM